ncbi:hypothetical protein [Uliginosibacterium aquaticum]|uniref:STAS/SEC14 domain-containing protein n=1 Tax=Uliginosibacterium aquaticum TaxID=2731212 RepID=A0ABX2IDR5_9RHOO|nr:hypothetical protein [Uliginosibacterium aquaticum]NSL53908.1 hypothetical protein [Uliginosibacterium aquaticum]
MIAEIGGPWNAELIHYYRELMAEQVPAVAAQGPWALILEIRGAALCPPEAVEGIRRGVVEHASSWRRICTAYVIASDVEGYGVTDRVWRGIYAGIMPFEIFEHMADARAWTQRHLDAPPPA